MPRSYQSVRRGLEPRISRFDPFGRPGSSSEWSEPEYALIGTAGWWDYDELHRRLGELLNRVSPTAVFVCGMTAVDMAWQCVRAFYGPDVTVEGEYREAGEIVAWLWTQFETPPMYESDYLEDYRAIHRVAQEHRASADQRDDEGLLYHAWEALSEMVTVPLPLGDPDTIRHYIVDAVVSSAWACAGDILDEPGIYAKRITRFMQEWWSRCRQRLAVRNPESVVLSGRGMPRRRRRGMLD